MSLLIVTQLRDFYRDHRQQLYTYAVSLTRQREAAEDAVHRVFEQMLRRESLPVELRPFIFRCVRNAALDGLRRAKVRDDFLFQEGNIVESDEATAPSPGLASELEERLGRLSPDERETIVLKIYNGLTFQEIADLRGERLPTVSSWYRRGLEKLKNQLEKTP